MRSGPRGTDKRRAGCVSSVNPVFLKKSRLASNPPRHQSRAAGGARAPATAHVAPARSKVSGRRWRARSKNKQSAPQRPISARPPKVWPVARALLFPHHRVSRRRAIRRWRLRGGAASASTASSRKAAPAYSCEKRDAADGRNRRSVAGVLARVLVVRGEHREPRRAERVAHPRRTTRQRRDGSQEPRRLITPQRGAQSGALPRRVTDRSVSTGSIAPLADPLPAFCSHPSSIPVETPWRRG